MTAAAVYLMIAAGSLAVGGFIGLAATLIERRVTLEPPKATA